MKYKYIIDKVENGLNLKKGIICSKNKEAPLTDIRICIYKILTVYYSPNEVMNVLKRGRVLQYYFNRRIEKIEYDKELRKMFLRINKIIGYTFEFYESNLKPIKVTRKQQEILYINKKVVSIEAGQIVNVYDFTFDELDSIGRFLKTSIL